jgi:hypothetical protein
VTTKSPQQKVLLGLLHTEDKSKQNHEKTGEEKTSNERVALTQLHTCNHLNNKNNLMTGITTYLSIITPNFHGLSSPIKRHHLSNGLKRKIEQSVVYRRPTSLTETNIGLG